MTASRALALTLALTLGACSGRADFTARPVVLATRTRAVDAALEGAERDALRDNDLESAEAALRATLEAHPADPRAPEARLLLARVLLARDRVREGDRCAQDTVTTSDPTLARTRSLVLGVSAARTGDAPRALALLRPLEGTLPDRAQTGELSCALADAEDSAGTPVRALRAVAMVETLRAGPLPWLHTGLSCEQPDALAALVQRALGAVRDPAELATVLDALPADSPLRRAVASRLRDLAETAHELPRWLSFLVDLPDDRAAGSPGPSAGPRTVLGVLAPLVGPRAGAGAAVVRGVAYALEGTSEARAVPADEGDDAASVTAAVDAVVAQGARAIVGVTREDLAAAAAIRAQALGVELYLLAPQRGVDGAGPRVHAAGPLLEARAAAFADAARARAPRAAVIADATAAELRDRVAGALASAGVTAVQRTPAEARAHAAADGVALVVGAPGGEDRATLARLAQRDPTRWVFDARAAQPGAAQLLLGVAPGPALPALLARFCARTGSPPEELALLAFDAAGAALSAARRRPSPAAALAAGWSLALGSARDGTPAAAAQCPTVDAPAPGNDAAPAPPGGLAPAPQ